LASEIGVELLGRIPIENTVALGSDSGEPVAISGAGLAAGEFARIADQIIESTVSLESLSGCSARSPEAVAIQVKVRKSQS
jgi:septum formation inhibitor-activating ATPase MinD